MSLVAGSWANSRPGAVHPSRKPGRSVEAAMYGTCVPSSSAPGAVSRSVHAVGTSTWIAPRSSVTDS